ncbi:thymidylate synthase [Aureibacillus halotolerans]|uniref:Thymidylate synthase n=1 Tax=Aureibacillus halotolerans TaxID=1508390 RepID=A0A4R6UCM9_9BACI|nr:thymidylate synthase [Aureibacillus halotolerans]TDQ42873.1 thymidylate synthase [Aureibacillus halotolerans]
MSEADRQYNQLVQEVIEHGVWDYGTDVRTKWESDLEPAYTKSIIGKQMRFTNEELPILTTKSVAFKTAVKELLWIWQQKSNRVQDLRDMNVRIWDQWEIKEGPWEGTIGAAYGYQMGKKNRLLQGQLVDQVDYLLHSLNESPSSRRHITMLWNPDDLDDMALTPCVYETQWHVKQQTLHLEVRCRSNDMGLGNPFNVVQYNVLQRMMAQVLGYKLGEYIFTIGDCHVYDRHIEPLQEQIQREMFEAPQLWINPDVTDFYAFTPDDFKLIEYKKGDKVPLEVAI